jgi:hypothetical protein
MARILPRYGYGTTGGQLIPYARHAGSSLGSYIKGTDAGSTREIGGCRPWLRYRSLLGAGTPRTLWPPSMGAPSPTTRPFRSRLAFPSTRTDRLSTSSSPKSPWPQGLPFKSTPLAGIESSGPESPRTSRRLPLAERPLASHWLVPGWNVTPITRLTSLLVLDCQALIHISARPPQYSSKYAGPFRESVLQHTDFIKIKAHMTQEAARSLGLEEAWFGNDRADYWANDLCDSTGPPGTAYVKQQTEAMRSVCTLAPRLSEGLRLPRTLARPPPRLRKPPPEQHNSPHSFRWTGKGWTCIACGHRSRTGKSRRRDMCTHLARLVAGVHPTHRAYQAVQAASGVPVVYCLDCGHYGTSRLAKLEVPCSGYTRITAATRLRSNKHPVDCGLLVRPRCLARMRKALQAVQAQASCDRSGSCRATTDIPSVSAVAPAPQAALAGAGGLRPEELPPDWDEEPPDPCSGDEALPDELQAEVALGWGFSFGLDSAYDD